MSALATANQVFLTTGTTGIPVITALATNGQLIIGSTVGAPLQLHCLQEQRNNDN